MDLCKAQICNINVLRNNLLKQGYHEKEVSDTTNKLLKLNEERGIK